MSISANMAQDEIFICVKVNVQANMACDKNDKAWGHVFEYVNNMHVKLL